MNIKFSIITVCYNSEKTIERTLKSIIAQTYKNFELIIIDGASKDNTLELINKYRDKIANITIVSEPDKGIYDAMNKGIDLSKGEYIAFLNSDDYYENYALEVIEKNLDSDVDILYGNTFLIDQFDGKIFEKEREKVEPIELIKGKMVPHTSSFFKSEVLKKNKFDITYKIAADYKCVLNLYMNNATFKYINYRISNMDMGGVSNTQIIKVFYEICRIFNELNINDDELVKSLEKEYKMAEFKNKLGRMLPKKIYIKYKYLKKGWKEIKEV